MKKQEFEVSKELKSLFNDLFVEWRKHTHEGLDGLATRCGVSSAYLGHIRRYGRVPGRPVLILLALNFGIDGAKLFRAAGLPDPFPFEADITIAKKDKATPGLLSVRLDMDGFTDAIKSVVRSELKQRTVKDVLARRPLRIGLNYHQYWMYDTHEPPANKHYTGIFPEFCRMLGVSLQRDVEISYVPFADYIPQMHAGELDIFGPTMIVPNLPVDILFSSPFYRLGVSGLARLRETQGLEALPIPKSIDDLRHKPYQIAVLKNSLPHLLCNTLIKRGDDQLILVQSDDEGLDRVMLKGVKRPAHIFLTNSITAIETAQKNKAELQATFAKRNSLVDLGDNGLAIRPDWPEVVPIINDAIRFLLNRGGFQQRISQAIGDEFREVVEI